MLVHKPDDIISIELNDAFFKYKVFHNGFINTGNN